MPRAKRGAEFIGRAFRGPDGVVRWVHAQSTRGLLHVRWLDESGEVWFSGATLNVKEMGTEKWPLCDEVPAPQPGDTFVLCGALGYNVRYRLTKDTFLQTA